MSKRIILLLCSLGLIFSETLPAAVESVTSSISQYMLRSEPLMLRNANGKYDITIPLSDRVRPISATLNLSLSNSNVLKGNRSQMSVYVNDFVVGQIKLDPINNSSTARFQIDPEFLKPGYNKITFKAAQHYTDSECEDWSAPELWTNIDTVKSTFTLNYQAVDVTEKLSALNELINDRLGHYQLSILRANAAVSDHYLYWGAMISQAVKLRLKYVPLKLDEKSITPYGDNPDKFAIDPSALKNDAVLVGTKAQIASLLPARARDAIQGPYLGIFRQDNDSTHFILVLSGNDDDEVSAAAQSFALLNARFPDQQQSVLQKPQIPIDASLLAPGVIVPGNTYQFSQLEYRNNLQDHETATLELRMPADFYSTEDAMVTLNLHLAYGAAMRKDSVVNITLNDVFVHAIHLKEPEGAHYQNYQITLPLRSFRAGLNTLRFDAELTPSESGECTFVQRNNLIATVYPDSSIRFPDAGHVAELPDLKLFATTGFPLAQNASTAQTVFKLLDTSSDTITSAWQLTAALAVQQQAPLFDLNITQGQIPAADNVALIGKISGISTEVDTILKRAPVKLGPENRFPYTYKDRQDSATQSTLQWLESMLFGDTPKPQTVNITKANVALSQSGGLGEQFLLMSYPHPQGNGVVLALLSAADNSLYQGLSLLESPSLWSQIRGNIFVWDQHKRFDWQQEGDSITLGSDNVRLRLIMHFSNHPWRWLLIIIVFLLITAWVTHKLLNKYQRTHH